MQKKLTLVFICLILAFISYSQTSLILIDFGNVPSPSPWNNLSNPNNGNINGLINAFGLPTDITLTVTDSFNSINNTGTQMPNSSLGIPSTASEDSYFGNNVFFGNELQPTGGIEIANLDTSKRYTFTIFSSRIANDNRETQYVFSGLQIDTAYLNVASNTDSVVIFSSHPANDGTVNITASTGSNNTNTYGFYYLGALKIEYQDSLVSPSLNLLAPNGGEFWQVGKEVKITWNSTTQNPSILSYSTDNGNTWNTIDTLPVFQNAYDWIIPNTPSSLCLVRVSSDTLTDQSTNNFEISSSDESCPIVVIGSSTAAGAGASTSDSAWVNRYRNEIYQKDTRHTVHNLALGGYTTYHLLPTGNPLAGNVGITIDTARNITKALSLNPAAVIINLPSNDAANNFSVQAQMTNFKLMVSEAAQQDVPVWVCTTQPRNFSAPSKILLQTITRDSILAYFGNYAIDFWSDIADVDGYIQSQFNSGDGVHLNDKGHKVLFDNVIDKGITDSICQIISVGINDILQSPALDIKIYPNPFDSNFKLEMPYKLTGSIEVVLYDIFGRELYSTKRELVKESRIIDINPIINEQSNNTLLFLKVIVQSNKESFQGVYPLLTTKP